MQVQIFLLRTNTNAYSQIIIEVDTDTKLLILFPKAGTDAHINWRKMHILISILETDIDLIVRY